MTRAAGAYRAIVTSLPLRARRSGQPLRSPSEKQRGRPVERFELDEVVDDREAGGVGCGSGMGSKARGGGATLVGQEPIDRRWL
jgi:hypothetical protein